MKYLVTTLGMPNEEVIGRGTRAEIFFDKGTLKKDILDLKTIDYFSKMLK